MSYMFNIDGIATDLSGKADTDFTNVVDAGTSRGAKYSMPSNTYISLTIGTAGSSYTAPADGWFSFHATSSNTSAFLSAYVKAADDSVLYGFKANCNVSSQALYMTVPVKKNQICLSGRGNVSDVYGYFIYAQGSEWEANQ